MNSNFSHQNGNGAYILVVDDEKSVLDMASIIFEMRGYNVITANNAFTAFETYEKHFKHIKAVLLDVAMPVMDGVALSRILLEINPEAQIILSSGQNSNLNELELRSLGIKHFLPKPYNAAQLVKTIGEAVHGKTQE